MTAVSARTLLSVPARPGEDSPHRPVEWRRMAWVTWRQHRVALSGTAALLGGLSLLLWIVGVSLHHAYAVAVACRPVGSVACTTSVGTFESMANYLSNGGIFQVVPALIGAFVGAPLLARELESGTYRFVWTQAIGRWRWTVAKVVLLGVVALVATGAFSVLLTWYYAPYFATGNANLSILSITPFDPGVFDLHGVTFAAWTLAAFSIGVLAGLLLRRVVPAIAATLAAYTGLFVAATTILRPHYLSPITSSGSSIPNDAWIMSQWLTKGGRFAYPWPPPFNVLQQACPAGPTGPGGKDSPNFATCLGQHGYTVFVSYHPSSQFWSFQWIEAGWLVGLSVLLVAATVYLVRRRAT